MDTLYMNLFDSTTSMGWINATIASVQAYGNVVLVHTVEEVGERLMPQTSSISYVTKKPTPLAPGMVRPFCCTIMLRLILLCFIILYPYVAMLIFIISLSNYLFLSCFVYPCRPCRECWQLPCCVDAIASGALCVTMQCACGAVLLLATK